MRTRSRPSAAGYLRRCAQNQGRVWRPGRGRAVRARTTAREIHAAARGHPPAESDWRSDPASDRGRWRGGERESISLLRGTEAVDREGQRKVKGAKSEMA